ncbi:MAG: hypothetical protein QXE22_02170 [Candidatus Bathyarchaeia archaeon]
MDERIRLVAHLSEDFKLLEMKQRAGVKSPTDEKTDREFYSLIEPIILGACSRLEPTLGRLKTVRIKYENVSIVFFRLPHAVVGLSMEPGPTTPLIEKVGKRFKVSLA